MECNNCNSSDSYCKKHERKGFLEEHLKVFKKNGDLFGVELLKNLIKNIFIKSNPLKPEFTPKTSPTCNNASLSSFTIHMEKYIDPLLLLMTPTSADDQRKRAETLSSMLNDSITHVVLMDGHGSFMLLFLAQVLKDHGKKRLDKLQIRLVDIDEQVTAYHQAIYQCKNIHCSTEDVTNIAYSDFHLVYMNFCGISDSELAVKKWLRCKPNNIHQPLLLSFSFVRRATLDDGKKKNMKARMMKAAPKGTKFSIIETGRKNFITLRLDYLVKDDENVEEVEEQEEEEEEEDLRVSTYRDKFKKGDVVLFQSSKWLGMSGTFVSKNGTDGAYFMIPGEDKKKAVAGNTFISIL